MMMLIVMRMRMRMMMMIMMMDTSHNLAAFFKTMIPLTPVPSPTLGLPQQGPTHKTKPAPWKGRHDGYYTRSCCVVAGGSPAGLSLILFKPVALLDTPSGNSSLRGGGEKGGEGKVFFLRGTKGAQKRRRGPAK